MNKISEYKDINVLLDNQVKFMEYLKCSQSDSDRSIEIVKEIWSKLTFKDKVGIQPMTAPASLIYWLQDRETKSKDSDEIEITKIVRTDAVAARFIEYEGIDWESSVADISQKVADILNAKTNDKLSNLGINQKCNSHLNCDYIFCPYILMWRSDDDSKATWSYRGGEFIRPKTNSI